MTRKAFPVAVICLFAWLADAATLRPTETEAASAVERSRAVALEYSHQMPDFLCTQTIRRSIRLTLPKTWRPLDVLNVQLRYSGRLEERRLLDRDGQPAEQADAEDQFGGLKNVGEFGGMLETVFDPATQAVFRWEEWKTVRGRAAAVYSYRVEQAHSQYALTFNPGYVHRAVVGFHGSVEVDTETGGILRLTYEAEDIPADFPMQYASTAIDYDFVEVAGRRFLLPVRSESETALAGDVLRSRNVSEFENYQKFAADSSVQFGDTVETRK